MSEPYMHIVDVDQQRVRPLFIPRAYPIIAMECYIPDIFYIHSYMTALNL